jgi:hypothetical protein
MKHTNVREVRFKLVDNARKVRVDRFWLYEVGGPDSVKGKSVVSRLNRKVVKENEI